MLRFLYRCVLRAHPAGFRQRFADEMLSIFDQTPGPLAATALLVDGALSLLRQWIFRPEFWEEPLVHGSPSGTPLFFSFESPRPRTGALIYGGLLSVLVLNGVCWAMAYSWNHPIFMDIRAGHGPAGRVPEHLLRSRPLPRKITPPEPPLSTDQGQVLLVFNSPPHQAPSAAPAARPLPVDPLDLPAGLLQSYVGTYRVDLAESAKVRVTEDAGGLQLEVAREFTCWLTPVSETRFVAAGPPDCQVDFVKSVTGVVERLEIYRGGRRITAVRQ